MVDHTEMDVSLLERCESLAEADQLIKVLGRNIDVVTEKPLAMNLSELTEVNASSPNQKPDDDAADHAA